MPEPVDICAKCLQPKQSSPSARMTQWIFICNCDKISDIESGITYQICQNCGCRVKEKTSGSLTQWVFKVDFCKCLEKKIVDVSLARNIQDRKNSFIEERQNLEDSIETIEVNPEDFPLDRYLPFQILGKGASGTVYLSKDRLLSIDVAVKTIHVLDSQQLLSFQNEARLICQLNHPGIVKILDFGATQAGSPYMVLEYVNGTTLAKHLQNSGRIAWQDAISLIVKICGALSYAHEKGIFHRDLKPGNILIAGSGDESVKIIDFGVAAIKLESENLFDYQGTTIVGTPAYMGPDQVNGYSYDSRSEVYSIGCVFFEMLTGEQLLVGESALHTINRHVKEPVPPLSDFIKEEFPERLDRILNHCLAKHPQDRYQSVNELKKDLLDLLEVSDTRSILSLSYISTDTDKKRTFRNCMVLFLASVTIIGIYFCFFNKKSSVVSKPIVSKEGDSVGSVIFSNKFQMNSFREEMWWFNIAPIKDEDIKDLSQLKDLERLWIDSGSLTSNSIMELKKYGLKKLGLADIVMNRDHMVALSTLSGLEELHFIDNHIKDNRLYAELKKLGSLRLLLINSKDLDKNGIEVISSSTDLEGLSLSGCSRIDDSSVAAISRMKNLKRLSVSDTSVTREGILMLLKLLELEVLSIANCSCDKDCMKALVSRKMQKISVRKCKLNEEDVLMLAGIPTLKFLDCRDIPSITNFTMSRFHQIRAAKNYSSCQVHFQSSSVIQQLAEEIDSSLDDYYIWR